MIKHVPNAAFAAFAAAGLGLAGCSGVTDDGEPAAQEIGEFANTGDDYAATQAAPNTPTQPVFGVDTRRVQIGSDGPDADACGGYGEITGLNPDGDNFLSVRAAPDARAQELDRLSSGTGVSFCEQADGWIGIVYEGAGTGGTSCGVASPVADIRDYDGPCRSGWISERFVELVAG